MAWDANAPTVSRLVGSGCLSCPTGSSVSADQGLGALETMAKNIMVLKDREFDGPKYPLSELPVEAAKSKLLGGEDYSIEYDYHIPNLHDIKMYNPEPTRQLASRVTEAMGNCGPEGIVANSFDMASIGCNPPRGRTGVMGKDASPILSKMAPLEMGPFCVTMFSNFDHLQQMFKKMQSHYPNAAMQVLAYQKIRDFIASCYNLASATAGSTKPRFSQFAFDSRPTSVGSIEWFADALDTITSYSDGRQEWKVCMSQRLFKRWMRDYAKKHNVTLNVDFSNLNAQVGDYIATANGQDSVTLISDRLNTKYTIDFSMAPIYVTDNQVGEDTYEWNFQPWFTTRAGDDTRPGEANGYVREKNPNYGAACNACPDGYQSLSEMILIYNGESHSYEAFPESPFAGAPELEGLETNLQNLWSSMNLKYYFGAEVQEYFLNPLFSGEGRCPSNIDNTWFAARMWFSYRMRLLRKRASGALLVKVPRDGMVNEEEGNCLTEEYPEAVTLTNREPIAGSRECVVDPEVDLDTPEGCLRPDCDASFTQADEDQTVLIRVDRVGGLATAVEAAYAQDDGTAVSPTDFTLTDGTLEIGEGATYGCIEVVIKGGDCVESDPATKEFYINWSGDDLCEDACTQTVIQITQRVCGPDEDPPVVEEEPEV